jgi:hypothetical protein
MGGGGYGDNIFEISCSKKIETNRPGDKVTIALFRDE